MRQCRSKIETFLALLLRPDALEELHRCHRTLTSAKGEKTGTGGKNEGKGNGKKGKEGKGEEGKGKYIEGYVY